MNDKVFLESRSSLTTLRDALTCRQKNACKSCKKMLVGCGIDQIYVKYHLKEPSANICAMATAIHKSSVFGRTASDLDMGVVTIIDFKFSKNCIEVNKEE